MRISDWSSDVCSSDLVAAVRGSRYEWLQHTILAADAGITPEEVRRVIDGHDADGWERFEEALVRAADELVATDRIGDDTWSTLTSELAEKAILHVIFTVGTNDALAMTSLSCGVEVDHPLGTRGGGRAQGRAAG